MPFTSTKFTLNFTSEGSVVASYTYDAATQLVDFSGPQQPVTRSVVEFISIQKDIDNFVSTIAQVFHPVEAKKSDYDLKNEKDVVNRKFSSLIKINDKKMRDLTVDIDTQMVTFKATNAQTLNWTDFQYVVFLRRLVVDEINNF